jgi:signal transduction histidine kinase
MMMHQMVIDILNYEAIESGKFKLNLEYADLHSLINETLQVFNNSIAEKSITLKPSLQAALHHSNIDAVKMRQVIENLLINCIKYTPEGSDITVKTWNEQDRIFTLISDNGRGFSEKELGELFVPFKKGLAAGNVSDSFGLGMSIVKKIIESHGGTISAANAPGGGAQFTITLPGKTAEEQ